MGNCLCSSNRVERSHSSLNSSNFKGSSRTGLSSVTSARTESSTPSTLTVPSYCEKNSCENLPTPLTQGQILSYSKAFRLCELKNATRSFRPENVIGEGGFGCVYKGWIDEQNLVASKPGNGTAVAIKKLKPESFQGHKEWLTEVNYLGQLRHPNLVKLIGYCLDGDYRLLVYEYMPKGSLENHLFRNGANPFSWALRIKVAVGAAKGLAFLHNADSQVIYRDVKASNILLDSEFNAKLSDFGLAKAGPTGDKTHVSTQVMGTHGYAAPEYITTGQLSAKADVYSFGVVLLELLSGRRVIDGSRVGIEQSLVEWAKPFLGDKRKVSRIMDTGLQGQYLKKESYKVATLALRCLTNEPKLRPSMTEVHATLDKLRADMITAKVTKGMQLKEFAHQLSLPNPSTRKPSLLKHLRYHKSMRNVKKQSGS